MPENWKTYKLGDIAKIKYGKDHKKLEEGTVPCYGTGGIMRYVNSFLSDEESVLIPRKGSLNSIFYVKQPFWTVDTLFWTRVNNDLAFAKYLYYYLKTIDFVSKDVGSAIPSLTTSLLNDLSITLPPLPEQRAIASILSAIDDKIENNLAMNKTLEEMAMALYKHWFVDFAPFKDGKFIDSELGKIPEGWGISTLGEEFNAERGLSYKGKFLVSEGEGLPMHNLNSIFEGGYYKHKGLKWYSGDFREKHKVFPGDLIVTNTEQGFQYKLIGSPALVPKCYGDYGLFSHHLYKLTPKEESHLTTIYLYYKLLDPHYRFYVTAYANGTTVNMMPKDGLIMPYVVVPPKESIKKFTDIVSSYHLKTEENLEENQTLTQLRDTLLPKLISGEVRLKEFEEKITAAL